MYFIKMDRDDAADISGKILALGIIQYRCSGQLWQDVSQLTLLKLFLGLLDLGKFTAEKPIKDCEIQGTPP